MNFMIHLYIMFQQVKDYKASNKPFSQLNMIKRNRKLLSEVICINHNFSHEFKDDVKWVLYSEHCYRTLGRLVLKLTITQVHVLVTPRKKTPTGIDRVFMLLRVKHVEHNFVQNFGICIFFFLLGFTITYK